MKRAVILLLALLILSPHAYAQRDNKFQILINGGYSLPQKPDVFKDVWNNGFNLGGGFGYRFLGRWTVQGLVNYDKFSVNETGVMDLLIDEIGFDPSDFGLDVDLQGGNVSVVSLAGELKVSFVEDPGMVSPYAIGGGGLARLATDDARVSLSFMGESLVETIEGESETKPMATLGGGVDIPISERALVFAEVRYRFVFTDGDRAEFITIQGGLRFRF